MTVGSPRRFAPATRSDHRYRSYKPGYLELE